MRGLIVFGALVTAVSVAAPCPRADAQSRGGIGGPTIGGGSSSRALGNRPAVTLPPPAIRSSPPPPGSGALITPDHGMGRYYKNPIGTVPPGSRATAIKPR
jgi:hypothetical protein